MNFGFATKMFGVTMLIYLAACAIQHAYHFIFFRSEACAPCIDECRRLRNGTCLRAEIDDRAPRADGGRHEMQRLAR